MARNGKVKRLRRGYRRRGTLTTRNIYGNRSARSQASQIAALRRRISNVARAQRPEIKQVFSSNFTDVFTNQALSNVYTLRLMSPEMSKGTEDNQFIGDAYRMKSFKVFGTLEYFNNKGETMHTSEPAGGFVRFIYFQTKTVNVAPVISELITVSSGGGTAYELNCTRPLVRGVTAQYRVLGDYKYTLTPFTSHRHFVHNLPIKYKSSLIRQAFLNNEYPQNVIWCVVVTSGLHWDQDYTETIQAHYCAKVAYTDN